MHQQPHSPIVWRLALASLLPDTSPLGSPPMVGEQLDLIREIMTVQRELQQQLGESQAEV